MTAEKVKCKQKLLAFMGKLYTILTDRAGHYALKLDKEFLYRSDDSVHGDKYAYIVDHFKSAKELTTEEDYAAFIAKYSVGEKRPDYIE